MKRQAIDSYGEVHTLYKTRYAFNESVWNTGREVRIWKDAETGERFYCKRSYRDDVPWKCYSAEGILGIHYSI